MKQKAHLFALSILLVVCFSSCSPRIFLPDRVNTPMLQEAGDVKLVSSIKIQNQSVAPGLGQSSSFDFAASPVNHLGLMASFRNTNKYANDDDWDLFGGNNAQDSIHYSGNRFEFGAGYYTKFGSKGVFEFYAGGATGQINRDNLRNLGGEYKAKYYRVFIQPAVGFNSKDIVEINGGIRFAYQKYTDFQSKDSSMRYEFTNSNADIAKLNFIFIEPFVNFSFGYKYVKFNLQPGFTTNVSTPSLYNNLCFYLSMGLTLQIAPRFRDGAGTKGSRD